MQLTITLCNEEGDEVEHCLPAKYEVCPRCGGTGKHTNPSIDGHGITASEWEQDWSYEEREAYFNGAYDVTCYDCKGLRVVLVPDEDAIKRSAEARQVYQQYLADLEQKAQWDREDAAIRRMESGGYDC